MELTLTAKVQWYPSPSQVPGSNKPSRPIIRSPRLGLPRTASNQPPCTPRPTDSCGRGLVCDPVIKTVIVLAHGHPWPLVQIRQLALDLVFNRDYSAKTAAFSLNTLAGPGMDQFFDGTWQLSTAHLVHRHSRWFLYTKTVAETDLAQIRQVVGLDFDMTFRVTAYGSQGCTTFFPGRAIKTRRAHFKILQQNLQRGRPSRRRLKHLGHRETRWMTEVNHQVSKACGPLWRTNAKRCSWWKI